MNYNIEIRDLKPMIIKLELPKSIKELISKSSTVKMKLQRRNSGGRSNIPSFKVLINGQEVHCRPEFRWGADFMFTIPNDQYIYSIEFSEAVSLYMVQFILENENGITITDTVTGKMILDNQNMYVDTITDNKELTFDDFQKQALHKLQRQFLSIPDTKDTVLTRKNIIEMIKDLKELKG